MKLKLSASLLAAVLVSAATPLAASAMTIGVTDSVTNTIMSGHLCTSEQSAELHSGTEWSSSNATKVGSENDASTSVASVVDPAASAGTSNGTFNVNVNTSSGTLGNYSKYDVQSSSLTGLEAQTGAGITVSTFANF